MTGVLQPTAMRLFPSLVRRELPEVARIRRELSALEEALAMVQEWIDLMTGDVEAHYRERDELREKITLTKCRLQNHLRFQG